MEGRRLGRDRRQGCHHTEGEDELQGSQGLEHGDEGKGLGKDRRGQASLQPPRNRTPLTLM